MKQAPKPGDHAAKLIVYPVGRQMVTRDISTNQVTLVPREEHAGPPVDQITALASVVNTQDSKAMFAAGVTDYNNPSELYVDLYEVGEGAVFAPAGPRKKIEVPASSIEADQKSPSLSPGGKAGSVDAGTALRQRTAVGSQMNTSTVGQECEPSPPVVSQIAFSYNFMYMAVLVSGMQNGVLVYDWRSRSKPTC